LTRILGVPAEELNAVVKRAVRSGVSTPFRQDVDPLLVSQIEESRGDLPNVEVVVSPRRFYPLGLAAAHILGYAGEINDAELETRKDKGYRIGDLIGRSGLERSYEEALRGKDGHQYVVVNALGRRVGTLEDIPPVPPRPGEDLKLALDLDVQQALEGAMANVARGAAVAIDPRTGGILAMVSRPSFDPNEFARGLSRARWQEFMTDDAYPLLNRAIQAAYPPGSTYKVVTSLAGLEENAIDPTTHFPVSCTGGYRYGNRYYKCWNHSGHGSLALTAALAQSCDVYYYQLGLRVGVDGLALWAQKMGLGAKTGIDLPQERSGLIPTSRYYDKRRGAGKWSRGVTLNLAIGQGEDLLTPLQLAMIPATVASRGRVARPHVVEQILDPVTGQGRAVSPPPKTALVLPAETWDALSAAMEQVVAGGTGGAARVPGVRVGGKTGTAQTSSGQDHALFICYAPIDDPQIAIAVVVEHGGHGGSTAAPIAQKGLVARLAPQLWAAQKLAAAHADSLLAHAGPRAVAAEVPQAAVPDSLLGD
ncbi:MAG: penicillin-binding protein 2, partial [Candidatus Eisenbacteria bacterium]